MDLLEERLISQNLLIEELWEAPKAFLISQLLKKNQKHVVVLTSDQKLLDNFEFFETKAIEFPAWETLPHEEIPPSPDVVGERYRILQELDEPCVICTSLQALLQRVLTPERLKTLFLPLSCGMELPFADLPEHFALMGYHQKSVAADKGEFAVRGGIIDIYPVNSPDPFRIEFLDDEILSIRKYDPVGQTSVGKVKEIVITPGEELQLLNEERELATLFDYLDDCIVVFDDPFEVEDKYATLKGMMNRQLRTFCTFDQFWEIVEKRQRCYFTKTPIQELSSVQIRGKEDLAFDVFDKRVEAKRWYHPFRTLEESFTSEEEIPLLDVYNETKPPALFVCQNDSEEKRILQSVPDAKIKRGYLSSGYYIDDPAFALIPMAELTGRFRVRRQKQRSHYHTLPHEMNTLTPGEAVVHMNNGIGRFIGIERKPNHLGVETEFMLLEYAEGAKLYIPMEQANMVSKYVGVGEEKPQLHQIESSKWKRARAKTEMAIVGYAKELLELQASRAVKEGTSYGEPSDLVEQFGQEFPYEETADQLLAIQSIYEDMGSTKTMERLVCGDVGYGKTEVAMRAAFRTVVDGGKQVAILVPTTVLAMQHYETFASRMANFPIRVGVLSRFRKPKQQRETLEKLAKGEVDIVVGTHRIVSKDVHFDNLGLLIIDEEQRFGVRAKEHLKKARQDVDCLTLSATPIPRTLYMSLVGARDLSVINTPPEDRLPIHSVIAQGTDEVLKTALLRELSRDGQVFCIHNRVESIYDYATRIKKLVPNANIVVGHGQMDAKDLDTTFHKFKSGEANILVATSIIENGIDIPNANTILIDKADHFGLAELYQMRGRVGRWNRKAYCYFLVNNPRDINPVARKRLAALTQASGHGGGMKIAMQDLEIRGAGNILGTEQSGHVQAVGFHLYCRLLKRTVKRLQAKKEPFLTEECKLEFPIDARFAPSYIDDINLRMDLYGRLGDAETSADVDALFGEVEDRFGPLPQAALGLGMLTRLRIFAQQNAFTKLKLTKTVLEAVQTHGPQKIAKKLLVRQSDDPAELEEAILGALKQNFPMNTQ
ncbi:MAG: Transcription-repair-coupling factor [Chlamydiales bacterium]|nr:Transcription-repair-coupling factor [Chlamydiales bacterium]MCH9635365.1 Transcription-repair-coupling factor [Chlamydiales bacterium]MCH9704336.1 transcription-repair coupling factor [Chlamydiota bacterium]